MDAENKTLISENTEKFQDLALQQAIKILSKKRITSKNFRKLERLTKIIFDVNSFNIRVLNDRLLRSRSCGRAYSGRSFQQELKDNLTEANKG